MCKYIDDSAVMPGYGCCRCRTYNGLQRKNCGVCGKVHCHLEIPPNVVRCASCGFGFKEEDRGSKTLTGVSVGPTCPVCGADLPAAPMRVVPARPTAEALVGPRDPSGAQPCDACRKPIRMEIPPQTYHRHRLCSDCFAEVYPEAKTAPVVDQTEPVQ